MKVFTNGARHWGGQIDRIDTGFRSIGHEVTPYISEADLIYSNNSHAQIIADKAAGRLKAGAKVILTCLDVPTHLGDACDAKGITAELAQADAVCTISRFGQWQVKELLGLNSSVIYNPIKPVSRRPELARKPFYRFAHIGRRSDENKRATLGVQALQLLGYSEKDLALVGNEGGWGDYLGVLSDENLNIVYNSVDFVMCCSLVEGLCLPVLEAMAAGAVPVVCNDMTTREELLPPDLFPEYELVQPIPSLIARFIATYTNDEGGVRLAALKERLYRHYLNAWADRVSPTGVAKAILDVYAELY